MRHENALDYLRMLQEKAAEAETLSYIIHPPDDGLLGSDRNR
ncbi:hypothetical protein [Desulfosporosinus shakirovi]|nr:hypothetical protein [Desulfosporosinus sp. SRJS8]